MSLRKRMLLAGLGALMPVILNLLVVDYRTVFTDATLPAAAGYAIRVVVLFFLGGLVAFLHKEETNPLRIFELGIIAPALVTALMNGTNPAVSPASERAASPDTAVTALLPPAARPLSGPEITLAPSRVDTRRADSIVQSVPVHAIAYVHESEGEAFLRGITGGDRRRQDVWFVVAYAQSSVEAARLEALALAAKMKGFDVGVYGPTEESRFLVVLGSGLTRDEAERLLTRARTAGFNGGGYLWPAQ